MVVNKAVRSRLSHFLWDGSGWWLIGEQRGKNETTLLIGDTRVMTLSGVERIRGFNSECHMNLDR